MFTSVLYNFHMSSVNLPKTITKKEPFATFGLDRVNGLISGWTVNAFKCLEHDYCYFILEIWQSKKKTLRRLNWKIKLHRLADPSSPPPPRPSTLSSPDWRNVSLPEATSGRRRNVSRLRAMGGDPTCVPPDFNRGMQAIWEELWSAMPQSGKARDKVKTLLQQYKEVSGGEEMATRVCNESSTRTHASFLCSCTLFFNFVLLPKK